MKKKRPRKASLRKAIVELCMLQKEGILAGSLFWRIRMRYPHLRDKFRHEDVRTWLLKLSSNGFLEWPDQKDFLCGYSVKQRSSAPSYPNPPRLTLPLREGDEVTLVNGEVHVLTRNREGDFEGNTPYYRWDENGEIAHAAMGYSDNRYEIVRHVPLSNP